MVFNYLMATNEHTIIPACHQHSSSRPRHDSGRANCMVVCSWPFLRFDLGGGVGRRGRQGFGDLRRERDAGRVRGAAGRGFGDAAEVRGDGLAACVARGRGPWRRFGGLRCAGRRSRGDGLAASVARGGGLTAGRGAGPWRGSAGHGGELGSRRSGREAVSSCLREIHLEPAIIDYQAVNSRKGCR